MAIKALELKKSIDAKRNQLAEIEKRSESFEQRAIELRERIESASTDEERENVEAEINELNSEKENHETECSNLREEIDGLENELKEIEEKEPEAKEGEVEERTMSEVITRDSLQYNQAFLRGVKSGNYDEVRGLLTEGVEGGSVPVPTQLETAIQTAWEEAKILGLVKKSYFKGNVRVGFEVSATGAVIHVEGTDAPAEEAITIGAVELKAQNIKKWITVSDEALEGTTIDTAKYLYDEIAHKIVEKAEETIIAKIVASPAASTATAPGVPVSDMNPAAETIVTAVSMLTSEAKNLHIMMNRATYPAFVKLALDAGYAIDVFDGLKDRIIFTDALPAFSSAGTGDTYAIVGDLNGAQANLPNGDAVKLTVDPYSLAEKDLVKIVGRLYAGLGVIAPKRFVKIRKVVTA